MVKISDKKKVELLEEAVLKNDIKEVTNLFNEHKKFEFTSRALGYACRYSNIEIVKLLIKKKVSFQYKYTTALQTKYGVAHKTASDTYMAQYYLMLLDDEYDPKQEYHFGHLPNTCLEYNTEEKRIEILDYLIEEKCGLDVGVLLYYAILWGNEGVAKYLINKGILPDEERLKTLSNSSKLFFRQEFIDTIAVLPTTVLVYVFQIMAGFLREELIVTNAMFECMKDKMINSELLKCLTENANLSKVKKDVIVEMAILSEDNQLLESVLQQNNIIDSKRIGKCIDMAIDKGSKINLAFLLEYKSRYINVDDEMQESINKMENELISNPFSVTTLKKIWSYEEQEDGTLRITAYKGNEAEVVVPAYIGKKTVTSIEKATFGIDPKQGRATNNQRNARMQIVSIEFPGTIKDIPDGMFFTNSYNIKYDNLKKIVLNDGISSIGESAFRGLENIEEIIISKTIKEIKAYAFYKCSHLKEVHLPEGLLGIGQYAFAYCDNLKELKLPDTVTEISDSLFYYSGIEKFEFTKQIQRIGEGVFCGCCSLETIKWPNWIDYIPKGTFAGSGISSITVENNINSIGEGAFSGCRNLDEFEIGQDVMIGMEAFSGCDQFADKAGLIIINNQFFGLSSDKYSYFDTRGFDLSNIEFKIISDTVCDIKVRPDKLPRFIYFDNNVNIERIEKKVFVGDELQFGKFILTEDLKLSPINWKVIAIESNKALCITTQALFSYNRNLDACWEKSQVRNFLNGIFMDTFFSIAEQDAILISDNANMSNDDYQISKQDNTKDKLFLLSIEEILEHMPCALERKTTITEYLRTWEPIYKYAKEQQWLTRSTRKDLRTVAVDHKGELVLTSGVIRSVIRPAVWINLDKICCL